SMAILIAGIILACVSPFVGRLVDRVGVRRVVSVAMPALALAALGMSILPGRLPLYLCAFIVLHLAGAGTSPVVFTRLVAAHFKVHRGLALGLLLSGTGIAAALAPAFFTPFIAAHGWREGYRLLAGVLLVALPIVLIGLGRHAKATQPTDATHPPATWPRTSFVVFLRDRRFRLMLMAFFLVALGVAGLIVHFVPMLLDGGMDAATAGRTAGLIGVAVILGRIFAGALIDRIHAPFVAAALLAAAAVGCVLLASAGAHLAGVAAVLIGLAMGAEVDLIGFLVARYLGLTAYGSAYGVIYGAFIAGAAISPFLVGLSFDVTGNYRTALFCAAWLLTGATLLLSRLGPYPAEAV
ncbi:MAG TPA: MFS transporter, partial [Phenylobacterium sp.]|uniref:MFS transporter n=1 Tax=Phenylobacterium sp. TaxID=1871053 RepID=UPI002B48AD81